MVEEEEEISSCQLSLSFCSPSSKQTTRTKKLKDKCIVNLQGTAGIIGPKGSPGSPGAVVSKILIFNLPV